MIRWVSLLACALLASLGAEEPPAWSVTLQRDALARAKERGALETLLTTRGYRNPERGEALLVRGELKDGVLRGTFELRTVGGMREERLVIRSDVRLADGAFVGLRFLLVRGASRVKGEAKLEGETLKGSVTEGEGKGVPFERPWDASALPMTWALAFLAPLYDGKLPAELSSKIYHGVEQALAPETARLSWDGKQGTLSIRGGLPGGRVARAGVKDGALEWLELGDGGRAVPLPKDELERLIKAQPVSLE